MKRLILIASGLLIVALLAATWMASRQLTPVEITPALTGQPEYCLTCHNDLPAISSSHPVQAFGCVICHGGERLALEADLAHRSMRGGANPSDLEVVEMSCGGSKCHSGEAINARDHVPRVLTSLHNTYAGAIAKARFETGLQPDLTAHQGISDVQDQDGESQSGILSLGAFNPAHEKAPKIQLFAHTCLSCHLSAEPPPEASNHHYTGCAACHSLTANAGQPEVGEKKDDETMHRLTTAIPYTQCNTCHNRGNYDLEKMEFTQRTDRTASSRPADRMSDYYPPGTRFTRCEWTLDCIDCHTRIEVMGDGDLHSQQNDEQYIRCSTCHGTLTNLPQSRTISSPEDLAFRLAFLNPVIDLKVGDTILTTQKGEPMWTVRKLPDGTFEQFGKGSGQRFVFKPVKGSGCQQKPEEQEAEACRECHAVK